MRPTLVRSMRASLVRRSDMPGGKAYNLWWGDQTNVIKQKGIIQYTIAPNHGKVFGPHAIREYMFGAYSRISQDFLYLAIPFTFAYGLWVWAHNKNAWLHSKEGHLAAIKAEGGEHHGGH
ncbi:cytochrome b-c1 complex subunit 8 [Flagelloscypha sp. PMI_526]|nr:cytochrome b-c1 complex subunit 8 [Flagelloscypha sp. PMI_526]